jgi:alkanesulfonate monooxygenase SsuD/methylene tetrahydromethanopterin reductase-like flavin-dependent oxidoreductase (luciferase family)
VTLHGRYWQANDAVLLPAPTRRPPLLIGSNGPRTLSIALPHVEAWNTWYDGYGNDPSGFEALNATITAAAIQAGRAPDEIARSACVLVALDRDAGERPHDSEAPPLEGDADRIASWLRDLAAAGADEAILVLSPINERSIRWLGAVLARLDS